MAKYNEFKKLLDDGLDANYTDSSNRNIIQIIFYELEQPFRRGSFRSIDTKKTKYEISFIMVIRLYRI